MRRLSVIVPCRNERQFIGNFLDELAAQNLPDGWDVEWLVADGSSDDGTRDLLEARAHSDARLRIVNNPRRIVSTGLNACLAHATGEVIARLDVHTVYAPDYLAQCIAALERSRADNVGGPWVASGSQPKQRAIAAAFQSRWVVGGARSRDIDYEGPAETVYLGCWPRTSFDRFGTFDEGLIRNQDDEHNLRISRAGGRIWQSAAIRSTYFPRASLSRLFAQQRQYGFWRAHVMRRHGVPAALRQLVPAVFVAAVAVAAAGFPSFGAFPLMVVVGAYALYLTITAMAIAAAERWRLVGWLFLSVASYHLGYGLGTWQGILALVLARGPSEADTRLTR